MKLLTLLLLFSLVSGQPAPAEPYGIARRPQPSGADFNQLLPEKVGSFRRHFFKAPQPGLDGEALYRSGSDEIFLLFSRADNAAGVRETMQTIFTETKYEAAKGIRTVSLKTDPAYIRLVGRKIAFFAWNRELYCFSADSKDGKEAALDRFMLSFPY